MAAYGLTSQLKLKMEKCSLKKTLNLSNLQLFIVLQNDNPSCSKRRTRYDAVTD